MGPAVAWRLAASHACAAAAASCAPPRARVAAGPPPKRAGKGFGGGAPAAPSRSTRAAPAAAPAASDSAEWAVLRSWLEARGATVDGIGVGIVDARTGLRGVYAARAFERGEPIFKVPRATAILDEARADASAVGAVWAGRECDVPACVRVALLVLFLLMRGDACADDWGPALAMLPTRAEFESDGGPLELWSVAEVSLCECAQLIGEVGARSAELRALYDGVLLPGWERAAQAAGSPLRGLAPPSFERVQWAVVAVSSRAYGEGEPGAGSSSMLVPAVDLCNHAPPADANTAKALAPWGEFVVIAARALAAGEEVTITYGPLPTRRLLQQFGFMLPRALATQRAFDVPLARLDLLWAGDGRARESARGDGEDVWVAKLPDGARDALAELARAGLLLRDKSGAVSRWQPCGDGLRAAVAQLHARTGAASYAQLLRRELGAFPSGAQPEADDAQLAERAPEMPPRHQLALEFRARAKRLLRDAAETEDACAAGALG
ncbi:hypothetical protein KFE25_013922 [Diacronema lutheri]|uniref:SET domain-containing protein n=2 Tax=Diacronema lutheri TaxID=2081491 RepID=A0A8J6CBW2_DIALT|nr:hypothetical protein KFE25_013922 [Diacronema lutheri]